jgi:acyl carrier protein
MDHYARVEQTVKEFLAKQSKRDVAAISADALLTQDLGLDSFAALEMAFELEEKFSIQIPTEALSSVKTVKDIVDYIVEQTKDKSDAE